MGVPAMCAVILTPGCKGSVRRSFGCGSTVPTPYPMPSCPSGAFCTTVADIARFERAEEADAMAHVDAATLAKSDASIGPPPPLEMAPSPFADCPARALDPSGTTPPYAAVSFDATSSATRRSATPTACCYTWTQLCGGGRPLRVRVEDDPIVAAPTERDDWCALGEGDAIDDASRASYWLREAAMEHASVASFARASLQLLALGAPPELVAGAHAAALDEIDHARLCYGIASRFAGRTLGPGALAVDDAPIDLSPSAVAVDTLLGGCLNEAIAALEARDALDAVTDPAIRAVLTKIAADEERHTELAWRTLAWIVRAHPSCVPDLERAISRLDPNHTVVVEIVLPCARALLGVTSRAEARTARTSRRIRSTTRPSARHPGSPCTRAGRSSARRRT